MFPGWIPLPNTFQYDFGEEGGASYTGAWRMPATVTNVDICKTLVSLKERFQTDSYTYKTNRIEHPIYPYLWIRKATIKGLDSFSQNTNDPFTDSTSNTAILQNVGYYEVTFEWRQKPWNAYKLKHARIQRSMEGSFEELPGSTLEAYPVNGGAAKALTVGIPKPVRSQEFRVVYDFVPASLVDFDFLEQLQGKINKDEKLFAREKGQVLYVNSESEDVVDSLGETGYRITHNFTIKPKDFNIVETVPPTASSDRALSESWANIKNLPNGEAYRAYEYAFMKNNDKLFYYGWEA